jgi:hypothetical protein
VIAQRLVAVFAAVFLVGSIAIGSLTDPGWPLGQLLFAINPRLLASVDVGMRGAVPPWAWDWIVHPILIRPAWLIPACIGIICVGLYVTLASRQGQPRSRRRRS